MNAFVGWWAIFFYYFLCKLLKSQYLCSCRTNETLTVYMFLWQKKKNINLDIPLIYSNATSPDFFFSAKGVLQEYICILLGSDCRPLLLNFFNVWSTIRLRVWPFEELGHFPLFICEEKKIPYKPLYNVFHYSWRVVSDITWQKDGPPKFCIQTEMFCSFRKMTINCHFLYNLYIFWTIVLRFNIMSTLVSHFVSSPWEREKRYKI